MMGLISQEELQELTEITAGESLSDRWIFSPFSILDSRQGPWQKRKRRWIALGIRSEIGRGEALNYGITPDGRSTTDATVGWTELGKRRACPGQSPRPAANYKNKERGDGAGRPLARAFSTDLMRGEDSRYVKAQPTINSIFKRDKNAGSTPSNYGTSIFDPNLCELVYQWFCPPGGSILDPFCGGSVRGLVAAILGRAYIGIDLSEAQIRANEEQADTILPDAITTSGLTPTQKIEGIYVKRDDLFGVAGVYGGKARSCWHLAQNATGLVTAGSRQSPQAAIVASIAKHLGIPCRVHTPTGDFTPELEAAEEAGAEIVQHKPGYNSVIVARAREDATDRNWTLIPFGMECAEAVTQTAGQVANIPTDVKRIVVPVGSGMSLAGILYGLKRHKMNIPVLGITVGADPAKRLDKYAPNNWRDMVTLIDSNTAYHKPENATLGDIQLDPIYEAKCLKHLQPGDLFWIVGIRNSLAPQPQHIKPEWIIGNALDVAEFASHKRFDFIFSCPLYADLEVYSDNPNDLSTMTWDKFLDNYYKIIEEACSMLRNNRFACFVVANIRDNKTGMMQDLVGETVQAFEKAGLHFYNDIIFINAIGSLPIRAGGQMRVSRKVGKMHQNILVFVKGDPKKAVEAIGEPPGNRWYL